MAALARALVPRLGSLVAADARAAAALADGAARAAAEIAAADLARADALGRT